MKIDLSEFARLGKSASGSLPWIAMTRVETPARDGALAWSANGSPHGRHGAPRLDLTVDGTVTLICQRCLQPLQEALAIRSRFLVVADEEAADALDADDEFDALVASREFDLDALVEDEVILALPSAPRHTKCPDGAVAAAASSRSSPFAALAALKSPGPRGGRA